MKIPLISLAFLLSLSSISLGQAPAKARDPWDGFAVGSWAIVHSRSEVGGKLRDEIEEHLTIESNNSVGTGSLLVVQKVRGRIIDTTQSIYANRVLAEVGFQLESKKDVALKIGDRELAVTVKTWGAGKEAKAQAALRKHFVQFLTLPKDSLEFELVSYEAKSLDLEIPCHKIELPGTIYSGPQVVKTEIRFARRSADGEAVVEGRYAETARLEKKTAEVKGKKIDCIVFDAEFTIKDKTGSLSVAQKGEAWVSNQVPGRDVKRVMQIESTRGKLTFTREVLDFEVHPDPAKLPLPKELSDRPLVPDPDLPGVRLGDWFVKYDAGHFDDRKENSKIVAKQIVRIIGSDRYIAQSKYLGDDGWSAPVTELIRPLKVSHPPFQPAEQAEIEILGKKVMCQIQTRETKGAQSTTVTTEWVPLDAKWKELLAKARLPAIKSRTVTTFENASFAPVKSEGELRSDLTTRLPVWVGDKKFECVVWEGTHSSSTGINREFHTAEIPVRPVLVHQGGNTITATTQVLDFGVAEKPLPDPQAVKRLADRANEGTLAFMKEQRERKSKQ